MARVPLTRVTTDLNGNVLAGIAARVKKADGVTDATLYAARTGPATIANPASSDAAGRVQAWVDRGLYRIDYSGTGLASWSEWAPLGAAGDGEIDAPWLGSAVHPTLITSAAALAALTPADGDEIYYLADATNGVLWHFRYRAASASAYKWEAVGIGAPLFAEVTAPEARANAAYGDLATVGPSITAPLAGDYDVTIGAQLQTNADSSAARAAYMSYAIGGTAAADADALKYDATFFNLYWQVHGQSDHRVRRKTGLAAATALVAKYRSDGASSTFRDRYMSLVPVRVG